MNTWRYALIRPIFGLHLLAMTALSAVTALSALTAMTALSAVPALSAMTAVSALTAMVLMIIRVRRVFAIEADCLVDLTHNVRNQSFDCSRGGEIFL